MLDEVEVGRAMKTYNTGSDIDAYCTKCKLTLAHVVVAMTATRVVKVECKTCRGIHAYRKTAASSSATRTPKAPKSTTSASTRKASRAAAAAENNYERLTKGQDMSQAQRYRTSMLYNEGEFVDHPSFGMGMVVKLLSDNKIEVAFPVGAKVLIHGR